jgi:hypothetical protein
VSGFPLRLGSPLPRYCSTSNPGRRPDDPRQFPASKLPQLDFLATMLQPGRERLRSRRWLPEQPPCFQEFEVAHNRKALPVNSPDLRVSKIAGFPLRMVQLPLLKDRLDWRPRPDGVPHWNGGAPSFPGASAPLLRYQPMRPHFAIDSQACDGLSARVAREFLCD